MRLLPQHVGCGSCPECLCLKESNVERPTLPTVVTSCEHRKNITLADYSSPDCQCVIHDLLINDGQEGRISYAHQRIPFLKAVGNKTYPLELDFDMSSGNADHLHLPSKRRVPSSFSCKFSTDSEVCAHSALDRDGILTLYPRRCPGLAIANIIASLCKDAVGNPSVLQSKALCRWYELREKIKRQSDLQDEGFVKFDDAPFDLDELFSIFDDLFCGSVLGSRDGPGGQLAHLNWEQPPANAKMYGETFLGSLDPTDAGRKPVLRAPVYMRILLRKRRLDAIAICDARLPVPYIPSNLWTSGIFSVLAQRMAFDRKPFNNTIAGYIKTILHEVLHVLVYLFSCSCIYCANCRHSIMQVSLTVSSFFLSEPTSRRVGRYWRWTDPELS